MNTKTKNVSWMLLLLFLLNGCGSWEGRKHLQEFAYIDGKMYCTRDALVEAKQAQYFTDASRTNMNFAVEGLGTASIGTSVIDAESLADIISSLPLPVQAKLFELLGVAQ